MKSLSYKIGLGYFVLICINIAIAVFAIYHINRLGSPVERVLKEKYQNVSAAENMAQALMQQVSAQDAMVEDKFDSSQFNNFNTYKNEFYNWHQRAIEGIALPAEPLILDSINLIYQMYLSKSDTLLTKIRDRTSHLAGKRFQSKEVFPIVSKLEALCSKLKTVNEEAIRAADNKAKQFSNLATLVIIVIAIIAILMSVAASIWFTQNIIQPVKQTTETVQKIGQGQLNQKVRITTNDEIAELGREFNRMTERLQAYEKMNIQQILLEKKKSEAIVAGIPVSIIVTDEENKISLMNESAMKILDISDNSWQGKTVREVVRDEHLAKFLAGENEKRKEGGDPQKALFSLRSGNEELFFLARRIKISDDADKTMGIVTLLQDVTSFKNLDRLKSEFMATISHEFKTPLTSINMAVDILLREVRGALNEEQQELLSDAKQDCRRLNNLVKDLLDLSKLESGKYPLSTQPLQFDDLLEYALQPLRFAVSSKHINLKVDIDPALPVVQGDFYRLSQVVTNLVENSVQHTPESGEIVINARREQNMFLFCVADSGAGIPEEAIDLIFDKFVQVKSFKDAEEGNIGLGLAIAREIIKAHGGEIWVESKIGKGSRFYFTIPLPQRPF
jgi:PAS domain S-box-containing protein